MRLLYLLAVGVLTGSLASQTMFNNEFEIYPEATGFTSRSGASTSAGGDVGIFVDCRHFQGIGQTGLPAAGVLNGFRGTIQDQNAGTREKMTWVIRKGLPGKGPVGGTAGVALRTAAFQLPAGPNSPRAWIITSTLQTPNRTLEQRRDFYVGAGIPGNSAWTKDGLSMHMAGYVIGARGDNPRAGTPSIAYAVNGNTVVNTNGSPRTHAVSILVCGGVLNAGADIATTARRGPNPNFGVAGYSPNLGGRRDGTAFRIRAGQMGGPPSPVAIGLAANTTPGIPLPGLSGVLYLNPASLAIVATATSSPTGNETVAPPFMAQGKLPSIRGRIPFQAFGIISRGPNTGGGALTNVTVVNYQ